MSYTKNREVKTTKPLCKFGSKCKYFLQGKCKFGHDKFHPEVYDTPEYTTFLDIKAEIATLDRKFEAISIKRNEEKKIVDILKSQLIKAEASYRDISSEWLRLYVLRDNMVHRSGRVEISLTRCRDGISCIDSYAAEPHTLTFPCPEFHPKDEREKLDKLWLKKIDESKELERKNQETVKYHEDIKWYEDKYFELGRSLKECVDLPDPLLSMIRDYCCSRPNNTIKLFDSRSHILLSCEKHNKYKIGSHDQICVCCGKYIRNNKLHIIVKIDKDKLHNCVYLCRDCINRYGIINASWHKGQIKQYLLNDMMPITEDHVVSNGNTWFMINWAKRCCQCFKW